jgi:hypothetical protein
VPTTLEPASMSKRGFACESNRTDRPGFRFDVRIRAALFTHAAGALFCCTGIAVKQAGRPIELEQPAHLRVLGPPSDRGSLSGGTDGAATRYERVDLKPQL